MVMRVVMPNFCTTCGEEVPDKLKYRKVHIKESPKKVRIPICEHCGNDLGFTCATLKE